MERVQFYTCVLFIIHKYILFIIYKYIVFIIFYSIHYTYILFSMSSFLIMYFIVDNSKVDYYFNEMQREYFISTDVAFAQ